MDDLCDLYKNFHQFDDATIFTTPLDYSGCCQVMKTCPKVGHIKLKKHKVGFVKCSPCSDYERAVSGALTLSQREQRDIRHFNQFAETKAQYYKSKR